MPNGSLSLGQAVGRPAIQGICQLQQLLCAIDWRGSSGSLVPGHYPSRRCGSAAAGLPTKCPRHAGVANLGGLSRARIGIGRRIRLFDSLRRRRLTRHFGFGCAGRWRLDVFSRLNLQACFRWVTDWRNRRRGQDRACPLCQKTRIAGPGALRPQKRRWAVVVGALAHGAAAGCQQRRNSEQTQPMTTHCETLYDGAGISVR